MHLEACDCKPAAQRVLSTLSLDHGAGVTRKIQHVCSNIMQRIPPKARRKMGHVNVSGPSAAAVLASIEALQRVDSEESGGSDPATAGGKRKRVVANRGAEAASGAAAAQAAAPNAASEVPIVGIIMGSDSDLPTMTAAAEQLEPALSQGWRAQPPAS